MEEGEVLALYFCGRSCQYQSNDCKAVGTSNALAWFAVSYLGCPPNGGLIRFILDESHQKGSDYVSLPVSLAY